MSGRLVNSLRSMLRPRDEVYRDASEGRQFHVVYFLMLVLACLISLLGLLLNSPAVIIGAMLISPLMGPILSCGLALSLADWGLGRKAGLNVALSVVETVGIAALATLLSPLKDATPEILARTQPNLMDLLVAFFSGVAGTLAFCSRTAGLTIVPGVAIATAVMPPLATTGYGLCTGQWQVAGGAFMLFFTNFAAIVISADVVFMLAGFRPRRRIDAESYMSLLRYRALASGVLILALSIPLLRTLLRAAEQGRIRRDAVAALRRELDQAGQRKLTGVDLWMAGESVRLEATLRTYRYVEQAEVDRIEGVLAARLRRPVDLDVQQVQFARPEPAKPAPRERDFLTGGLVREGAAPKVEPPAHVSLAKVRSEVLSSLTHLLRLEPADSLALTSLALDADGTIGVEFALRRRQPTEEGSWPVAAAALARELQAPVRLSGTVLSRGETTLAFRPGSRRAAAAELRKAEGALGPGLRQAGWRLALAPPAEAEGPLWTRRLAHLRSRLGEAVAEGTAAAEGPAEPDQVRVYLVRAVDVRAAPPAAEPTERTASR